MPWRSAEQLLAENPDDAGPAFGGALFALNQSRLILKAPTTRGSTEFAAVYRCQSPDLECQCFDCWNARRPATKKARQKARDVHLRRLAVRLSRSPFPAES